MKYVAEKFTVRVLAAAAVMSLSVQFAAVDVSAKEYKSAEVSQTVASADESTAKSKQTGTEKTKKLSKDEKESEAVLKSLGYDSLYTTEQNEGDGSADREFFDPYDEYFMRGSSDESVQSYGDDDYLHLDTFIDNYSDQADTENSSEAGTVDKKEIAMIWPVPTVRNITDKFGWRYVQETGRSQFHKGIDINKIGCKGEEILAAADGVVTTASNTYNGYGIHVIIEHNDGHTSTLYGHMSETTVNVGDEVKQGDVIGYIGNTGEAYGYHCHFEVRVDDEPVDPLGYVSEDN